MVIQERIMTPTGQGQTIEMFLGSLRELTTGQPVKFERPGTKFDTNEDAFFRDFTLSALDHIEKKTLRELGSSAITILRKSKPNEQVPYLSPVKIYEKLHINLNRDNQSREEIEKAEGYIINGSRLMFKKLLTERPLDDDKSAIINRYKSAIKRYPEKYTSYEFVSAYQKALTQLFAPRIKAEDHVSTEKPRNTGECIRIKGADGTSHYKTSIQRVFDYYSFNPKEKELLEKETDPKKRAKLLLKAGNAVGFKSIKVGQIIDNFMPDENWYPIAKKPIPTPNPTATPQP